MYIYRYIYIHIDIYIYTHVYIYRYLYGQVIDRWYVHVYMSVYSVYIYIILTNGHYSQNPTKLPDLLQYAHMRNSYVADV